MAFYARIKAVKNKLKIIVILGQTATGKSDFAVQIAKRVLAVSRVESEIISADSRQVYKDMDLGTGKITKKEMRGVPHHLLDVASPKKIFSVSDYQKLADKKIQEIFSRGHIPILCGGTGFYIDALVNGTVLPEVAPDKILRKKLDKKSTSELFKILKKLDINRAKSIDKNNRVRLIRAIEIAKTLGKVPKISNKDTKYDTLKIGLTLPESYCLFVLLLYYTPPFYLPVFHQLIFSIVRYEPHIFPQFLKFLYLSFLILFVVLTVIFLRVLFL
jgi:tRNA dimethylallyltransferase